jgi:hypothetical protein
MPTENAQDEAAQQRPKMQFNLSALVGLIVVCAVVFGGIKIVKAINDAGGLSDDIAILGWLLFISLALVNAVTHWMSARNYQAYIGETKKSGEETKVAHRQAAEQAERGIELAERSIRNQEQIKQVLEDILSELRTKPD